MPVDVVVAGLAILISALAATAGWWQTHVIAQQLSAQVWPFVTIDSTADNEHLQVNVDNDGLGPAIIESFIFEVDGKPQRDVVTGLHALTGPVTRGEPHADLNVGSVDPGQVLKANSSTTLFRLTNKAVVPELALEMTKRVTFKLCYCSIVQNCWTVDIASHIGNKRPSPVSDCPDQSASQLEDVTASELQQIL